MIIFHHYLIMSKQYTATSQYIQGPKGLGSGIRIKFNSKTTITNQDEEVDHNQIPSVNCFINYFYHVNILRHQ